MKTKQNQYSFHHCYEFRNHLSRVYWHTNKLFIKLKIVELKCNRCRIVAFPHFHFRSFVELAELFMPVMEFDNFVVICCYNSVVCTCIEYATWIFCIQMFDLVVNTTFLEIDHCNSDFYKNRLLKRLLNPFCKWISTQFYSVFYVQPFLR